MYRILQTPFYYGITEYPKNSGNWYQGKHQPLITLELYTKVQTQLKRDQIVRENKEFAFTKLMTCGLCGSGVSAEEKYKTLSNGTSAKYVYYGCSRGKDRNCHNTYIREEELIQQLLKLIDQVSLDELGMRHKLEAEYARFNKFQQAIGSATPLPTTTKADADIKAYAKYLLKEGSISEKRELLINLKSKLIYNDKQVSLSVAENTKALNN